MFHTRFTFVSHSFHIRFTFVSHFLTNFAVNWMNQRPLSALLSASARLGPPPPVSARLCPVLRRIVPRCQLNARVIGSIWLIRVNNRSDLTYTTLSEPLPQNQQQWRYCPPICRRNSRPNKRVNNARAVLYTTEQDNDREMARNWFRFRIANFLFRQWNGQPLTYNRKKKPTNQTNVGRGQTDGVGVFRRFVLDVVSSVWVEIASNVAPSLLGAPGGWESPGSRSETATGTRRLAASSATAARHCADNRCWLNAAWLRLNSNS